MPVAGKLCKRDDEVRLAGAGRLANRLTRVGATYTTPRCLAKDADVTEIPTLGISECLARNTHLSVQNNNIVTKQTFSIGEEQKRRIFPFTV